MTKYKATTDGQKARHKFREQNTVQTGTHVQTNKQINDILLIRKHQYHKDQ